MAALMPNGISVSATSTNSFQTMAMKLDYSVAYLRSSGPSRL